MTEALVRPAIPSDALGIAAIYDAAVLHSVATFEDTPPGPERWLDKLAHSGRGDHVVVAVDPSAPDSDGDGEHVVGFAYSSAFRPRAAYRFTREWSVYVTEGARGRGVGGSLYAAAEALCRADGIRVIIGVVAQPNPASNALHDRLGFRAAGQLDGVGFKFDRWLGIRFYQRDLA